MLFVLQGAWLGHAATPRGRLRFTTGHGTAGAVGWLLIAYAAVLYPLVGLLSGQALFELPAFGLTPCPLTLTTLGCLLLTEPPTPRRLWPIPLAWSLVGGSAAFILAMPQDWPLLVAGVGAAALLPTRRGRETPSHPGAVPPQPVAGAASRSAGDDPGSARAASH